MAKKVTSFRVEPKTLKALKLLAKKYEIPVGDVLDGLVEFTESKRFISDPACRRTFGGLLDTAMLNTGQSGGFIPSDVEDRDVLKFLKEKTAAERERRKQELLEELRKLEGDE